MVSFAKVGTGQVCMSCGVDEATKGNEPFLKFVLSSLGRHTMGDWGDVDAEDKKANDNALIVGERVLSAYKKEGFPKIWIITEADRSSTTILFPEEY